MRCCACAGSQAAQVIIKNTSNAAQAIFLAACMGEYVIGCAMAGHHRPAPGRLQHAAHNFLRQRRGFGRQRLLCGGPIALDIGLCGLHLRLGLAARFVQRHWCELATPPGAALPARGRLRPGPPAISVRTQLCAPRPQQCRPAIFLPLLQFCCAARRARAATACARSRCRARKATPAESPSVLLRAVIPLVVGASDPCGADSRSENEGYENC